MTAEVAAFVRSWPVGTRTVTLTMPRPKKGKARAATMEWSPDTPAKLNPAEWKQYRTGRDQAMADLAEHIGGRVAVLEL